MKIVFPLRAAMRILARSARNQVDYVDAPVGPDGTNNHARLRQVDVGNFDASAPER